MNTPKHRSLLAQVLTPRLEKKLAAVTTSGGFTLDDITRSGKENPDSSVGVYAPDAESYDVFAPLLHPVIEKYHGFSQRAKHKPNLDASRLKIKNLDPSGKYVISTRVRVGRNLAGFAFAPGISKTDRLKAERQIVAALRSLTGDLKGAYHPLAGMGEKVRAQMVADHFLFKQGDRFLQSAGANRDWPSGRGIFHSKSKQFLVWVNEEDQLRIISMEQGGNIHAVFDRLARAANAIEKRLPFALHPRFGYLSSCPTNLGTAMRASVHIRIPLLSQHKTFKSVCAKLGLSIRGIHGEHSESEGGVYDISNKRRLGISEIDAINVLCKGVKTLIDHEKKLESKKA